MEQRPPSDGTFALVPSAEPGIWDFKIAIHYGTPKPDSGIAAGTTYAAAVAAGKIPSPCHTGQEWDAYVAARREEISPGVFWQNFVRSLPSTPNQAQFLDLEIWGPAKRFEYLDLISNSRPDRGDLYTLPVGVEAMYWDDGDTIAWDDGDTIAWENDEYVQDVQEADLGNGLCKVTLITVPGNTVTITETSIDESSGEAIDRATTYTLSATKPAGASVGDDGYGTTVDRVSHNLWKSTRAKLHGLPTAANPRTWADKESMYWPPVLVHYEFQSIRNPNRNHGDPWFEKKLFTYMKEGYSAPVDVDVVEWWQKEEPAALDQAPMVPTRIYIAGMFQTINIPECLHGEFVYTEAVDRIRDRNPNTSDYEHVHEDITLEWRIGPTGGDDGFNLFFDPPTGYADWPETYKVQEVIPEAGGFRIRQKTFHRPDVEVELSVTSLGHPSHYERLHS